MSSTQFPKKSVADWFGENIQPGESRNVCLSIGESYSGAHVGIDLQIRRAPKDGPTVFVTAALHGDELNGCGAVRQLIQDEELKILRGALILVPVLNPAHQCVLCRRQYRRPQYWCCRGSTRRLSRVSAAS